MFQLAQQPGTYAVAAVRGGHLSRGRHGVSSHTERPAGARALLRRVGPHAADRGLRTAHTGPLLQDAGGITTV